MRESRRDRKKREKPRSLRLRRWLASLLAVAGITATIAFLVPWAAPLPFAEWDLPRIIPPLPPLDGGKEKDNRPDYVPRVPGVIWSGPANRRAVAITFDDGPDPVSTPHILAVLREHGVVATFFIIGNRAELYPQLVRDIAADGHEIANHTYTHARMELLTEQQAMGELRTTTQLLSRLGRQPIRWFRPPYGNYNDEVLQWVERAGLSTVLWSVDSRDWDGRSAASILARVLPHVRAGSIILLHCAAGASEAQYQTVAALPDIIYFLRHTGYSMVTISQLLEGE